MRSKVAAIYAREGYTKEQASSRQPYPLENHQFHMALTRHPLCLPIVEKRYIYSFILINLIPLITQ